jgi:hypothetical protein
LAERCAGQYGQRCSINKAYHGGQPGHQTWLARPLLSATYTEAYDGTGTNRLTLRNFPVTAITSLTVETRPVNPAPNPLSVGYLFDEFGVYLSGGDSMQVVTPQSPNVWAGSYFPRHSQNVQITYTAGYATVPDDINQACIELVAFKFQQRNHVGVVTRSLNAGGESVSYQQGFIPPEVQGILQVYRKVVPA